MSYEEEDTCASGSCDIACMCIACMTLRVASLLVPYEAEDACHMRRWMHVI